MFSEESELDSASRKIRGIRVGMAVRRRFYPLLSMLIAAECRNANAKGPLLDAELLPPRTDLCCQQFLQVHDRVVLVALHTDLLTLSAKLSCQA